MVISSMILIDSLSLNARFTIDLRWDGYLQPTFTRAKRLKEIDKKIRKRHYRHLLLDEISNKHKRLKILK